MNIELQKTRELANFKNNKLSISRKNKLVSADFSRFDNYKTSLEKYNKKCYV